MRLVTLHSATNIGVEMSEQELENNMREWLLDCYEDEYDQEQINQMSYRELIKAINWYYDGGIECFVRA